MAGVHAQHALLRGASGLRPGAGEADGHPEAADESQGGHEKERRHPGGYAGQGPPPPADLFVPGGRSRLSASLQSVGLGDR